MTIAFSGLASGLDTSSWVESLVALRQAKITTLEEKKENVLLSKETLDNIKSFFTSFRSVIKKVSASLTTTLGNLSLNADGTAVFEVRGGTNLSDVLDLTTTVSGKYVTSNALYHRVTVAVAKTTSSSTLLNATTYVTADLSTTLAQIGINGNQVTADDTVGTLIDHLALYGFESVLNENGQLILKNTGNSLLQNYVGTSQASNALELLRIDLNTRCRCYKRCNYSILINLRIDYFIMRMAFGYT